MICGPQSVFLLDSISTGLDSSTTFDIMTTLKVTTPALEVSAGCGSRRPQHEDVRLSLTFVVSRPGNVLLKSKGSRSKTADGSRNSLSVRESFSKEGAHSMRFPSPARHFSYLHSHPALFGFASPVTHGRTVDLNGSSVHRRRPRRCMENATIPPMKRVARTQPNSLARRPKPHSFVYPPYP